MNLDDDNKQPSSSSSSKCLSLCLTGCLGLVTATEGLSTIPMNLDDDNKQPSSSSSSKCLSLCLTGCLGLVTATEGDSHRTPNVLESASLVKSCSSSSSTTSPPPSPLKKDDPGGIGFIDDVGGGVNGLMSCTESLGFESSDERRVDDDDEIELCCSANKVIKWRKIAEKREVKKFPPLISSLDHYVHPCFFLRPVRKDGRLELRAVRIDRPEIFRAHREGGRLRLHLVGDEDSDINDETRLQDQEYEL
ncbi:hypothetical protein GH714_025133 [Hevea brasiliensis]|uniref:FAF domain-containing protein n=1 Tax=Hevea brasiliensis TaxID=3981 RepID=A0A6A6M0D3_HEVBR|nr:hypothetical protein GH714_025133 [Hevea brasiliensis]